MAPNWKLFYLFYQRRIMDRHGYRHNAWEEKGLEMIFEI